MNKRSTVLLLVLVGCGSPKRVDVGDESREVTSELSSYIEDWDGYAESYEFAGDGNDRVRISINPDGTGTFRGGSEALFGAATDPDGLYPPTYGHDNWSLRTFRSGFEYPLHDVKVSNERLRFSLHTNKLMDSWCALQPMTEQGWTCSLLGGTASLSADFDDDGNEHCYLLDQSTTDSDSTAPPVGDVQAEVNCVVMHQCPACKCDDEGCSADDHSIIEVDAALSNDGESLEGTMQIDDATRVTLRLKRPN